MRPKIAKKMKEYKKISLLDSSYAKARTIGGTKDRLNIPSRIPNKLKIDL
jgi:hypothetical protein